MSCHQVTIEQACRSSDEGSRADSAHKFGGFSLPREEVEERVLSKGTRLQWRDQVCRSGNQLDIQLGTGGKGELGKNLYAFERSDSTVICGN